MHIKISVAGALLAKVVSCPCFLQTRFLLMICLFVARFLCWRVKNVGGVPALIFHSSNRKSVEKQADDK